MTFYLHIDSVPVADFHDKTWAETISRALDKWENSVNHLPHRDFLPKRHIVLTDKHTGDVIYDSRKMAG